MTVNNGPYFSRNPLSSKLTNQSTYTLRCLTLSKLVRVKPARVIKTCRSKPRPRFSSRALENTVRSTHRARTALVSNLTFIKRCRRQMIKLTVTFLLTRSLSLMTLPIYTSLQIFRMLKSTVLKCKDCGMLKTKATNLVHLNLSNTSSNGYLIRKNQTIS